MSSLVIEPYLLDSPFRNELPDSTISVTSATTVPKGAGQIIVRVFMTGLPAQIAAFEERQPGRDS